MTFSRADTALSAAPGRTTVTARALQHLAVGLARDAAGVSPRDVSVDLSDEQGTLRVSVSVPVALVSGRTETLVERGEVIRRSMVDGMRELSGRNVGVVDVRYSGVRRSAARRVT